MHQRPKPNPAELAAGRQRSLGSLSKLSDSTLFHVFTFLTANDLVRSVATVSWIFYHFHNTEELWRRIALEELIDEDTKTVVFSYKGSWKLTVLRPMRDSIAIPAAPSTSALATSLSPYTPSPATVYFAASSTVAVQDWKLQNHRFIARLEQAAALRAEQEQRRRQAALCYEGIENDGHGCCEGQNNSSPFGGINHCHPQSDQHLLKVGTVSTNRPFPAPAPLAAHVHCDELRGSYSINHALGLSSPPPYAALRQKDSFKDYNLIGQNLLAWPMNLTGIDRQHQLSVEDFVQHYEAPNRPVLITGVTDTWAARWKWQPDAFVSNYGEMPLRTNARSTSGKRFRMKTFDFMSYAASWNGEKPIYCFDKKLFLHKTWGSRLARDFAVPPYFREDIFDCMSEDDRPDYRWMLVGANGSGSPFHTDPHDTSAWNAVMSGCKRVSFYPPHVIPPGVDEELIDSDVYASDDVLDWYRNTFPKLSSHERPMEVLVAPGEILFIPSGWWHQVLNIGTTIAVTQNYCSSRTWPRVIADINKNGGTSLRQDLHDGLQQSPQWRHLAPQVTLGKRKKSSAASA